MSREYYERVLDYWKSPNGEYIVKVKQDENLECETDTKNRRPAHLGSLILSKVRET